MTPWGHMPDREKRTLALAALAFAIYIGYQFGLDREPHPLYDEKAKVWRFDQLRCAEPGCTAHVLGYQWAKDHRNVKCPQQSKPFYEGCQLYVEGYEDYLRESQETPAAYSD